MNECGNLAAVNMSSSGNGSGEKYPISVEEISELLCPSDCTFNGKCINGSCVCNKDYTAEDCSMSIYQIPTISRSVNIKRYTILIFFLNQEGLVNPKASLLPIHSLSLTTVNDILILTRPPPPLFLFATLQK